MSGLKLVLPARFTDDTLPVLSTDPVVDGVTSGPLILAETADLRADILPGGPAQLVPNLVADRAANLVGAPAADTFPRLQFTALTPASATVERTARGALHFIHSQTNGVGGETGAIYLSEAILDYLVAHPDHEYGLWMWTRTTRAQAGTANIARVTYSRRNAAVPPPFPIDGGTDAVLMMTYGTGTAPFGAGKAGYYTLARADRSTIVGLQRSALAVSGGWYLGTTGSNTVPTVGSDMVAAFLFGGEGAASEANGHQSVAFYRLYLEDLTVSGRTPAQVDALDKIAYDAAFGPGGRYAGDSWSDPATVLP